MRGDEEEEEDVREGPGWLATLLGAGLLLAAGFGVGLVVGAVREEPAMLLQYVTGKSATLPAPSPVAPPSLVPAAGARPTAAPPAPEPDPVMAEEPAPRRAPPVLAPAAASPPPSVASGATVGGRFAVQVGAFSASAEAGKLEALLVRKGLPAYVQPATGDRESRWRVRVGPLPTREEADRVAAKLKSQDKLPVWVLEESG